MRAFLLLLLLPSLAAAQPLTFDRAIGLAGRGPRAEGLERAVETRRAGDQGIAGTAQALNLQATPGGRVLSEQDQGFEGTFTVTQTWILADVSGARGRAAQVEREVLGAEARAAALLLRLEAAHQWIELWTIAREDEALADEAALAAELVALTERGLRAGVRTVVDASEAEAYRAEVAERALALEGMRTHASLALSAAMASEPRADLRTAGEPPAPPLPDDLEVTLALVERLPSVAVHRLTAAALRAHDVEMAASYGPQLTLGAQVQRESPSGFIVQGVAALSIPLFDQGQRSRSAALGEAERAEGELGHARLEAASALADAVHEREHTRQQETLLTQTLLPALDRLVAQREASLRAGEGTLFELIDARRRRIAARARAARARGERAWAEVRLWLMLAELERSENR